MFVDRVDRKENEDVVLAGMHPKAYEATMEARRENPLIKIVADFFKNLLAKSAR